MLNDDGTWSLEINFQKKILLSTSCWNLTVKVHKVGSKAIYNKLCYLKYLNHRHVWAESVTEAVAWNSIHNFSIKLHIGKCLSALFWFQPLRFSRSVNESTNVSSLLRKVWTKNEHECEVELIMKWVLVSIWIRFVWRWKIFVQILQMHQPYKSRSPRHPIWCKFN